MTQIINPPSAAGIEYGAGGGTEDYLQKVGGDGNLTDSFQDDGGSLVIPTGKSIFSGAIDMLTYNNLSGFVAVGYQVGQSRVRGSSVYLGDALTTYLNTTDNQFVFAVAPVYNDVAAAQMTADGTITVTKPPHRIILSADANNYVIQGLAANQINGMSVILENPTANAFILGHENGTATAANRFNLPGAVDYTIPTYSSVTLTYNGTLARWVVANYITP